MKDDNKKNLRYKIHEVIFEADTPYGKYFDIALIVFIIASVVTVLLESVPSYNEKYGDLFLKLEWIFTIFFTIEYILRLYAVLRPWKYATSFYGIIDFLAILPTYISLFVVQSGSLMIIRAIRLLRIFRIFKMVTFVSEANSILRALMATRRKIQVFIFAVLLIVMVMGSLMYLIEGRVPDSNFDSIPRSIYWAIVTLTTVGYGDISPNTNFGQFIAACLMILGYAVIAVPSGIVTSELINPKNQKTINTQSCRACSKEGHDNDAEYCKFCGTILDLDD